MRSNYSTAKIEVGGEPWLGPVDSLFLLYQLLISVVVITVDIPKDDKLRLLGNHAFLALGVIVLLWNTRNFSNFLVQFFREFYPLMAMLFLYREVGLLVHGYFDWTLDEWLLGVDNQIGQIGFRVWNFQEFSPPSRALTEFFSIGYSFYFFLVPISALALYFRAPLAKYRSFLFTICFTYYLHYLLFIFLPAESPRFYMPGLRDSLQGYWVAGWLQTAVEGNAFPGGSFPSSHIAAAVICFMAYPYLGKARWPVFFLTLTMVFGTIYGRYHYFIDVAAGLAMGVCCYFLAPLLERKWPLVFDEEGIARGRAGEAVNSG